MQDGRIHGHRFVCQSQLVDVESNPKKRNFKNTKLSYLNCIKTSFLYRDNTVA